MKHHIYELELALLQPAIRQSPQEMDKLIADEFIEFGRSGKIYNKKDVIQSCSTEETRNFMVEDFKISELSENVILATYKTIENNVASLRSSIWKLFDHQWKIVFHQGTVLFSGTK